MQGKKGQAYVFINYVQALKFGHIGWGFLADGDGRFLFGSTDHLWRGSWWDLPALIRYAHVAPAGDIDWWLEEGSRDDMFRAMRSGHHIWYHAYKEIAVEPFDGRAAYQAALEIRRGGWSLLRNNCVHQTSRVLGCYGAAGHIPPPELTTLTWIPRVWFAAIGGRARTL